MCGCCAKRWRCDPTSNFKKLFEMCNLAGFRFAGQVFFSALAAWCIVPMHPTCIIMAKVTLNFENKVHFWWFLGFLGKTSREKKCFLSDIAPKGRMACLRVLSLIISTIQVVTIMSWSPGQLRQEHSWETL